MITKPMLAVDAGDISLLRYPVIASPKLDGIRCLKINGKALSRSFKPIPNNYIRGVIENSGLPDGVDGEIVLPDGQAFNSVSSAVMRREGTPSFRYMIFDYAPVELSRPFYKRVESIIDCKVHHEWPGWSDSITQLWIYDKEGLELFEEFCIKAGYEGLIVRDPNGPYKCGRSTLQEGYMLKIKRFLDSEGVIVGWEEMQHNNNPAFEGELGQTKRSSHQMFKESAGVLGAITVRDIETGIVFNIGTGFTMKDREDIWSRIQSGEITKAGDWLVSYKYQPHGVVEKPRSPVFKGLRHVLDMA